MTGCAAPQRDKSDAGLAALRFFAVFFVLRHHDVIILVGFVVILGIVVAGDGEIEAVQHGAESRDVGVQQLLGAELRRLAANLVEKNTAIKLRYPFILILLKNLL